MDDSLAIGWDDTRTVHYYEEFCKRHGRYQQANEALVSHACLQLGQSILDFAAGTGRTADVTLPKIGEEGRMVCVEPSGAMRAEGEKRLSDPRISWMGECPEAAGVFDRILCGAAIWQLFPLPETFRRMADLLVPGGALCFNIPWLYLGEGDEAGGGRDPLLLELPSLLARQPEFGEREVQPPPKTDQMEALLEGAGLKPARWDFRIRLTQAAYRDWLKIPVITNNLLPGMDPGERARAIDAAFSRVDEESWRWERWIGWTAWKPGESESDAS